MKLVLTVMVRDEADIIKAMIEHHLAQGIDLIIATDNGSIDGTREILETYRDKGVLVLHDDPVHMKQQHSTVTKMAREAYTDFDADWVINADADEFWVPVNRAISLHEAFSHLPQDLQAFLVPVTDMTGLAAAAGSQFDRLNLRDHRSNEELMATGLLAHSTPDAVHVGSATVEVAQGNHFVSLSSGGNPDPEWAIEVLHLPWRSWEQYRRKVENAGQAYDANPELSPSPNHHGMRDYARLKDGTLLSYYLLRHPTVEQIDVGLQNGTFVTEEGLLDLNSHEREDVLFDPELSAVHRGYGAKLVAADIQQRASANEVARLTALLADLQAAHQQLLVTLTEAQSQNLLQEDNIAVLESLIEQFRTRKVIRAADKTTSIRRRVESAVSGLRGGRQ